MVHELRRIEGETAEPTGPDRPAPALPEHLPAAEEGARARVGAAPASPPVPVIRRPADPSDASESEGPEGSRPTLAGAASDQLRTTLALISGYSQTLLNLDLDDDERRQYLNGIVVAVEDLSEQAAEILAIAEDDARQAPGRPSERGPSLRLVRPGIAGRLEPEGG